MHVAEQKPFAKVHINAQKSFVKMHTNDQKSFVKVHAKQIQSAKYNELCGKDDFCIFVTRNMCIVH